MATLLELRSEFFNGTLLNKVEAATVIAAQGLLDGTSTAADRAWAAQAFGNPTATAKVVLMSVLASNAAATPTQIQQASDATIQSAVNAVVPALVAALAGT